MEEADRCRCPPGEKGGSVSVKEATSETSRDAVTPGREEASFQGLAKVVVQLSEASVSGQEAQLRACVDLCESVGENSKIELVAYGPAVRALVQGHHLAGTAGWLASRGVGIRVCHKSLVIHGVLPRSLVQGAVVVASGMEHVAMRQMEGWAYIRP